MENNYNGALEDVRPDEEKVKDFKHEEIASAISFSWKEREPKKYLIFNQDGSSACVANGVAKVLGIDEIFEGREFVNLSRRDIYVRRTNVGGGMYLPEALSIACKHGATLESLVPSENKGETAMNLKNDITADTDKIAEKYKAKNYIELPIDIDTIASIILQAQDQGKTKGVLLGFRFDYSEWTDVPKVDLNSKLACGHGVAGVDAILKDGKKYIVIDDSWGLGYAKFGQRYISEEFLKARCFYAGYTVNLILEPEVVVEKNHFVTTMRFGVTSKEVKLLQAFLQKMGLFPKNVTCTGYFGSITKKAVMAYQKQYGLTVDGVVGPKTRAVMNK